MEYKGCIFLEQGINFDLNTITDCCILHHNNRGLPFLIDNYNGEEIDWDKIFNIKEKRIEAQKISDIYECKDCYHLGNYQFENIRKISEFHFSHCRICNAKCIYCSKEYNKGSINYDTYPIIKDLIEKGYYKAGGEATFQGGEPTMMQHFDELIDLFIQNGTNVRVHTSAIKYSPKVYEALKNNKGSVVISLDSGCSETYKKIKQVDTFKIVTETIQKYSEANSENIIIKYIIIPNVNDNINEIDKFFKLLKKYNIKNAALDIELQYARKYDHKNVSPHIYLLVDYFNKGAEKQNIKVLTYSFLSYVLQNRTLKPSKLISFKPLYSYLINRLNNKKLAINYLK